MSQPQQPNADSTPERHAPSRKHPQDPEGPFKPYVQQEAEHGPMWNNGLPEASLRRIRASATVEEAGVQATTEAVILLHSIRRTLIWTLIIVPLTVLGLLITIVAVGGEPTACTSVYSCR
ncbi:hypothetical protein [Lentzea sp. CC55]|uniref:hypothetical protein n=1 Tax=Lentzea sp. CC55 TaxID=2884909 RepID=UPI001F230AAD|nr:hypothetical protein [Lentzea sp. CC55]MCG8926826.1 hypothetical protein [Lentzea sp. CC55]